MEHKPVRDVISKIPYKVKYRYPVQCPACGAQMDRATYDRVIGRDQGELS